MLAGFIIIAMTKKLIKAVPINEDDEEEIQELCEVDECYIRRRVAYHAHQIDQLLRLDACPVNYRLYWHFQSEMKRCDCHKIPRLREKLADWQKNIKPYIDEA